MHASTEELKQKRSTLRATLERKESALEDLLRRRVLGLNVLEHDIVRAGLLLIQSRSDLARIDAQLLKRLVRRGNTLFDEGENGKP